MKVSFTKNQNNWLWNTLVKRRHVILIEKNKFLNEKIALLSSGKTEDYVKRHMITFPKSMNEERNLIAIAHLARPIRKRETDDYTFKLKLDI